MFPGNGTVAWRLAAATWIVLLLAACAGTNLAPVGQRTEKARTNPGYHVVEAGESLYSIAWRYDQDYRNLARWNGIRSPYIIRAGQRLRVAPPEAAGERNTTTSREAVREPVRQRSAVRKRTERKNTARKEPRSAPKPLNSYARGPIKWQWPSTGRLLQGFNPRSSGKKGIDLDGRIGDPVRAAADGRVVYSGSGLIGYGRLVIVKHSQTFLSAYAHNSELLVKEGDRVKAGMVIARLGDSGTKRPKLHFQIRREGKPVDPLKYLPKR